MEYFQILLALAFITLVYNVGQLFFMLTSGVHNDHYFLGFNPKIKDFKISNVKFTLGVYIPIFPFARIYKIENGKKERVNMVWELNQFPIWKRVMVTFGGTFSLILAGVIIFIVTNYFRQEQYISKEEVNKKGIYPSELARKAGFERGDKILSVNGEDYEDFDELINPQKGTTYQIVRDGKNVQLTVSEEIRSQFPMQFGLLFLYLQTPFEIGEVFPNTPAEEAGLMKGDVIHAVNGNPVFKQFEFRNELSMDGDQEVIIKVERRIADSSFIVEKNVQVMQQGTIGISIDEHIVYSTKEKSFSKAVVNGLAKTWDVIVYNISAVTRMASREKHTYVTSKPVTIASVYQEGINWYRFWVLTGSLVIVCALLTLLPFPRACFWEVIPFAYEGFTGKQLSFKTFNILNKLSYILLGSFILFSIVSDVMRHWG